MKEKTIYALGFFDGVHTGHRALLRECRGLAGRHGCQAGVVTFGNHPDTLVYGNTPGLINTTADREWLLRERFGMDRVVTLPFDEKMRSMHWRDFLLMLVREYDAAGFVCGADFRFGYRGECDAGTLEAECVRWGLPCAIVPEQTVDGIRVSSTHIRRMLESGEMDQAGRFLGHPHFLTGEVVGGRHLGHTLGFPTANVLLPEGVICPRHGVYACKVHVEERCYSAVTNVGSRPTVQGRQVRTESWLLDFSGDLYGRRVRVEFYAFLRPERKFESLEALREQVAADAVRAREYFQSKGL